MSDSRGERVDALVESLKARVGQLEEEVAAKDWLQRETFAELEAVRSERDSIWNADQEAFRVLEQEVALLKAENEAISNSIRLQVSTLADTLRRAARVRICH